MRPSRFKNSIFSFALVCLGLMLFSQASSGQKNSPAAKAPTQKGATTATKAETGLTTEVLGAKALLEDLIIKRFTQELATRVNRESFQIAARLDLSLIPPEEVKAQEPIDDLALGHLDPESLMKKYAGREAGEYATSLLSQYKIASLAMSVGLRPELGDEQKAEVDKWLKDRLGKEFGNLGTGEVIFTQSPKTITPPQEELGFMEKLNKFQGLAGQVILAIALLIGALLWGLLAAKSGSKEASGGGVEINMAGSGEEGKSSQPAHSEMITEKRQAEQEVLQKDISELNQKIVGLAPKISPLLDPLVRMWVQQGESGRLRLACFTEATGKTLGSMPIPVDAIPDVTKMFMQMPNVNLKEKRETLQKAYWDAMAMINLGPEALNQPFSYVGGLNVDAVNQVLMEQNPKMKTLVTLFMPEELRTKYLRQQNIEAKRELLENAAGLSAIAATELKQADASLSARINGKKGTSGAEMVKLEMTIQKIADSLTPMEEIELLRTLEGDTVRTFKKTRASLAFVHEWQDEPFGKLVNRTNVDELVAFLRVRPDLSERVSNLAATMTARMLKDELNRPDSLSDTDKNRLLTRMTERIQELRDEKEIDLENIFEQVPADSGVANAA